MRLLRVDENGEFSTLTEDQVSDIPSYAILSHTWGDDLDEVNFRDLTLGPRTNKAGYRKLKFCAKQAARDGLRYIWVDTCCIDKSNHTELSEAINSMFRWYQRAEKCYVYLSDVQIDDVQPSESLNRWEPQLRQSRWFTRGWTLQELLAPSSVEFFCSAGSNLGDKISLERLLFEITGISIDALRGAPLSNFSVSERLSWAETRRTKREEDKAYSLLGIFDIYIPLIYGEGMNSAFKRLQNKIEKSSHSIKDTILLNSLPSAVDAPFNSYQRQHEPICLPDTRVNLLREIYGWGNGQDERFIFWLNGLAGTGKSTIARTVARTYFDKKRLGASFFFSRGGGDVSNAYKFVTSVAVQLARSVPNLYQHVCDAIKERSDIINRSLQDQWHQLILRPLSKLNTKTGTSTYILIIDALDECADTRNVRTLIHLLSSSRLTSDIKLRIFLTSRPELPIRYGFAQIPLGGHRDFVLHNIAPSIINHDIYLFLQYQFGVIREEQYLDASWPGENIIRSLVKIASGLFIWAATACRFIREGRRFAPKRLEMILRDSRSALTAPEKHLDEIYSTVLRQTISSDYTEDEKEESCSLLRQILGSIVTLLSPLCMPSLSRLIRITKEETKQTLDDLHSILDIPTDQSEPMHQTLLDKCIGIMSKSLKQNLCGVDGFGTANEDISHARVQLSLSREVQYSCLYWVQHLEKSEMAVRDDDQVHEFLGKHLLHWLEALSWMQKVSEAIYAIDALKSVVLAKDCPRLSAFIHDAQRFVLYGRSAFDKNPLQLYSSALLFAPEKSLVRQKFKAQVPSWVERLPNVREDWNALHQTLEADQSLLYAICFSSDSKLLVSASESRMIRIWEVATGIERQSFELKADSVMALCFSPDGNTLAIATFRGTIRLWDAATGLERQNLCGHKFMINIVAFSLNGKQIASGSQDKTVKLWDVATGTELHTLAGHEDEISVIRFLPNNKQLASASKNKSEVKLWDVSTGIEIRTYGPFDDCSVPLSFSLDGKLLAARPYSRIIRIWDLESGNEIQRIQDTEMVNSVTFSPDSEMLITGAFETVTMWHLPSGGEQQIFEGHKGWIASVIFSPDGKMVASAASEKTIKLWNATVYTREESGADDHKGWINFIGFSPDGKLVASASHNKTVKLWDAINGTGKKILGSHDSWINDMIFSPDSKLLATAGDKSVKLWDAITGEERRHFEGQEEWVNGVVFSPDGTKLASISIDRTIKVWDVATGAEQNSVRGGELRLLSPLSHSLTNGDSTYVTFGNASQVDILFFWIDVQGISKHYWTLKPGQERTQQTYVGHLWRFVNGKTNKTVGAYCGLPEHVDVVIKDEDVNAVEDNKSQLQSVIQRLVLWSIPSDASLEDSRSRLVVDGNWITDSSGKRLVWLPDEYRPTCTATDLNTLVLGHASGRLTFVEIKLTTKPTTKPTTIPTTIPTTKPTTKPIDPPKAFPLLLKQKG